MSDYLSPAGRFIVKSLDNGSLKRSSVETVVLKLAQWRDYAGLGCTSGQLGFPAPGTLGERDDHTHLERAQAWQRDVTEASDQLLAEAWCQLWSRNPPARLGETAPPGLEGIGGRHGRE